jgi:ElaB/YqjD/DUF883 family membrane-anchored ribosome-binding protein
LNKENVVAADAVLSRELKNLHEELLTSRRERSLPAADQTSAGASKAARASQPQDTAQEQELRNKLSEFVETITEYVEEAEKNVSAHPAASVAGAMVVGILIGRLLGRR